MIGKKGSLNLSIQMIVIVVIAFVVLGLGLGFVRTQFSSIGDTSTAVQDQISQQILEDLRTGNKPLSFPASKLTLESGEESVQAIGIKNIDTDPVNMKVEFSVKASGQFKSFNSAEDTPFTSTSNDDVNAAILWDDELQYLEGRDTLVMPVTITAPDKLGNYLYKVNLVKIDPVSGASEPYATKTFFIKTT